MFSAAGLLFSNVEHTQQRSVFQRTTDVEGERLRTLFAQLEAEVREDMRKEGVDESRVQVKRLADLRYTGQAFELTVPAEPLEVAAIEAAFHAEHKRTYGHSSEGDPVDLINIRVVASAARESKEGFAEAISAYNAGNQQLTFGGQTLTYDLNGNLTSDGVNTYTWNARNQLVAINGASVTGNLHRATADGNANCGSSSNNRDVWYTFVARCNGTLHADMCGSRDIDAHRRLVDTVAADVIPAMP